METVERIRSFNRAYTAVLGLLDKNYLESQRNLTEIRVLYEVFQNNGCSAKAIGQKLWIDAGYMSRVIKKLVSMGLLKKAKSASDLRCYRLYLTEEGHREVNELSKKSSEQIARMIENLDETDRENLVCAMTEIMRILNIQ